MRAPIPSLTHRNYQPNTGRKPKSKPVTDLPTRYMHVHSNKGFSWPWTTENGSERPQYTVFSFVYEENHTTALGGIRTINLPEPRWHTDDLSVSQPGGVMVERHRSHLGPKIIRPEAHFRTTPPEQCCGISPSRYGGQGCLAGSSAFCVPRQSQSRWFGCDTANNVFELNETLQHWQRGLGILVQNTRWKSWRINECAGVEGRKEYHCVAIRLQYIIFYCPMDKCEVWEKSSQFIEVIQLAPDVDDERGWDIVLGVPAMSPNIWGSDGLQGTKCDICTYTLVMGVELHQYQP